MYVHRNYKNLGVAPCCNCGLMVRCDYAYPIGEDLVMCGSCAYDKSTDSMSIAYENAVDNWRHSSDADKSMVSIESYDNEFSSYEDLADDALLSIINGQPYYVLSRLCRSKKWRRIKRLISDDMWLNFVQQDIRLFPFIPKKLHKSDIIRNALAVSPLMIYDVTETKRLKFFTYDVCEQLVSMSGFYIFDCPINCVDLNLCLLAIEHVTVDTVAYMLARLFDEYHRFDWFNWYAVWRHVVIFYVDVSYDVLSHVSDTYDDYVGFLTAKYGCVNGDYFVNEKCVTKNKSIVRTCDGLQIHHVDEDKAILLADSDIAVINPYAYQKADRLVYANLVEHLLLHIKIVELDCIRQGGGHSNVGRGGMWMLIQNLNDYFGRLPLLPTGWRLNMFSAVSHCYFEYLSLLRLIYVHPFDSMRVQSGMCVDLDDLSTGWDGTVYENIRSDLSNVIATNDIQSISDSPILKCL